MHVKLHGKSFGNINIAAAYAVAYREIKMKVDRTTPPDLQVHMLQHSDVGEVRVRNASSWLAKAATMQLLARRPANGSFEYWTTKLCWKEVAPDLFYEASQKEQMELPGGCEPAPGVDEDLLDRMQRLEEYQTSCVRQFAGLWKRATEFRELLGQVKDAITDYENRMRKYANGKKGEGQ